MSIAPWAPPAWMKLAACAAPEADPDWWFPDNSQVDPRTRAICDACPVRQECLNYATSKRIRFGVWGGQTASERDPVLRASRRAWAMSPVGREHKRQRERDARARLRLAAAQGDPEALALLAERRQRRREREGRASA